MEFFPENQIIHFIDGSSCNVVAHVGVVGSKVTYRVLYYGMEAKLEWISGASQNPMLYDRLLEMRKCGAPSDNFEWPLAVTECIDDQYGYLTAFIPEDSLTLGVFQVTRVKFRSPEVMITACSALIDGFIRLNERGLCYHNMDESCISVNPADGKVYFRQPEYIARVGDSSSYQCAPFINPLEMLNNNAADTSSECFSIAYMLFVLIYGISPFAGRLRYEYVLASMAPKAYVFIMDPHDDRNRVPFNLETLDSKWNSSPDILRNTFIRAFSKEAIHEPQKRVQTKEWVFVFRQAKIQCITCPECGKSTFVNMNSTSHRCMRCSKEMRRFPVLKIGNYNIPLLPGQEISEVYLYPDSSADTSYASVISHPQHPDRWGLMNKSDSEWMVTMQDGTSKALPSGKIMPVSLNAIVSFSNELKGEIVY